MKLWVEKYKGLSLQFKVVIWFTFCNFLQRGIATITIPIYTRVMSSDEYGLSSVYNAYFTVLVIICTLYLQSGVMNNVFTKYNTSQEKVVSVYQSLSLVTASIAFVLYLCFRPNIIRVLGLPESVVTAMFILFLFWPSYNYWLIYKRYRYEYVIPVIITVIISILTPIFGITGVLISSGNKGVARIISEIVLQCIIGFAFYIVNYRRSFNFFDSKLWSYAVKFNVPLIPSFLSEVLLNQSDRIMISFYCGMDKAGIYSIAYSAASLIMMVSSALNAAFIPWQYQMLQAKEFPKLKKLGYFVLIGLGGLLIMLVLFAPEVIKVLAGNSYMEGVNLIPVISAGIFLNIVCQLFYRIELFYEQQNKVFMVVCTSVVIKIVLNVILLPIYGFKVAGYTTFIGYTILCIMHYLVYKNICKKNLNGFLIYKGNEVIIIIALILFFMFFIQFLYRWIAIRFVLLFVIVLFVILAQKYLNVKKEKK